MDKLLGRDPLIGEETNISNCKFGSLVEIGFFNNLENVEIGDWSYTGEFVFIQNAIIGKFANIAATVRIGAPGHPIERASLHHFTYRRSYYGLGNDESSFFEKRANKKVLIGNDTWIGHGSVIMPGVIVGDGAVIGSASVVTKNVEPYTIVAGNPAKEIRKRFPEDVAKKLQEIKWWDWGYERVKSDLQDFYIDIDSFVEKHYRESN